jgi:hypothetical protein
MAPMTRLNLLSTLIAAPLAAFVSKDRRDSAEGERIIHFGPGRYTITPGGGIWITGARSCRIENCRIENAVGPSLTPTGSSKTLT